MKILSNPDNLLFAAGVAAAFASAMARNSRVKNFFSKSGFLRAVADAFTCSLYSSGVILAMHQYFQADYAYSILIGVFIGSVGSTYSIAIAVSVVRKVLGIPNDESQR